MLPKAHPIASAKTSCFHEPTSPAEWCGMTTTPPPGLHRQEEGRDCAHCQRPIQRLAPRQNADRKIKTIAECLADELINAAQGSSNRSTADSSSEAASNVQKPMREKNEFHSKINTTYSKISPGQINPKVRNRRLKYSGIRPKGVLTITKSLGILRQIKVKHNVFESLGGRRTGRIAEAVEVDVVGNTSGCLEEGVHEGLEGVLFSIRYLESS